MNTVTEYAEYVQFASRINQGGKGPAISLSEYRIYLALKKAEELATEANTAPQS